jgi:hypothetical protein
MADTKYLVKYRLCAWDNSSRPEVKAFTDKKKALEFYRRLRFEAHAQYKTVTFVEETTYKTEELKEMMA